MDFSNIAERYERLSTIQQSASEILFSLLDICSNEDVLDVGCGTGNLTARIREFTNGNVVGIDVTPKMIQEAQNKYSAKGIAFDVKNIQEISYTDAFNVVFCNSTFQWFKEPGLPMGKIFQALKPGGRVGIQAPATQEYCPNFIQAIAGLQADSRTRDVFSHFTVPWMLLETDNAYRQLFEVGGFNVAFAAIQTVETEHTPDQVYNIFSSGAIAGYLDPGCYTVPIDLGYIEAFKKIIQGEFEKQADARGIVKLVFHRIYLVASKPIKPELTA